MDATPEAIGDALASGETDRVTAAVETLDPGTAADRFDAILEACEEVSARADDGYRRQAAVRVVDAFATAWFPLTVNVSDPGVDAGNELDPATVRDRREASWTFLLDAVQDDDGRVRRAAVRAMTTLGVAAKLGADVDELDAAIDALENAITGCDDPTVAEHLEAALKQVRGHRPGPQ